MKKLSIILACTMLLGLLGGCGNSFDASAYTKALLDNSYKNDSTDFVKMELGTAEEAAALYEEGLDAEMDAMLASADIPQEEEAAYRQIFADILAGAKYTVGEAEKQDDDSYVVTVTYEQMQVFKPAFENYYAQIEDMIDTWTTAAEEGEEVPTEEEMYAQLIESLKTCFNDAIANATYAEPATTTIRIELVDNMYSPNEDDIVKLETVFFDIEEAEEVSSEF